MLKRVLIIIEPVALPAELEAVIVYVVNGVPVVGVPLSTHVELAKLSPEGRAGLAVQEVGVPPVNVGVTVEIALF